MKPAGGRLNTIAVAAVCVSGVAPLTVLAHLVRTLDNPINDELLPGWQQVFADGSVFLVAEVSLAAVVLVLMLPSSPIYRRARQVSVALLGPALVANIILTVGFLVSASQRDRATSVSWHLPSTFHLVVSELPGFSISTVLLFALANSLRLEAPRDTAPLPPRSGNRADRAAGSS